MELKGLNHSFISRNKIILLDSAPLDASKLNRETKQEKIKSSEKDYIFYFIKISNHLERHAFILLRFTYL